MRIRNTSRYNDVVVRELVTFGMRGVRTERLSVHVRNARNTAFRGMAYDDMPAISPASRLKTVDRLVTLGVGAPERFPCNGNGRYQRAPAIKLGDWREALIMLAAHEARHIWQYQYDKPRSEVDCERFAARRLDAYRDHASACVFGGARCASAGDVCCWSDDDLRVRLSRS